MGKRTFDSWLSEGSKFIKIKVGDKYSCIFRGMRFDETGGFQNKPTVKYLLESLEDGEVREFSSSSKKLAEKMRKLEEGDSITIIGSLDDNEKKTYRVVVNEEGAVKAPKKSSEYDDIPVHEEEADDEDEESDEETEEDEDEDDEEEVKPKKKKKKLPF